MVQRETLDYLAAEMTRVWKLMCQARERDDWQSYWKIRRSWLALGRLYSIQTERAAEESRAQLTLLPETAGRAHDREAG